MKGQACGRDHMAEAPNTIIHTRVLSREMVRIALMAATLDDLEVKSSDIFNAFVQCL